jgi:hypothetical protein
MTRTPVLIAVLLAAAILLAGAVHHEVQAHGAAGDGVLRTDDGDTVHITPAIRDAGPRFGAEVTPADRAWILGAIARARPPAQRLIAEVDGMVTFRTAGTHPAMGLTQAGPHGFTVWFNVAELDGERTIDRDVTVLHELGHVIDFALIPAATDATLDAGIPRGAVCDVQDGVTYGSCAATPERIADTFAKWALGGEVSAVGAGYAIAMPASLEDWGMPLIRLSVALPH